MIRYNHIRNSKTTFGALWNTLAVGVRHHFGTQQNICLCLCKACLTCSSIYRIFSLHSKLLLLLLLQCCLTGPKQDLCVLCLMTTMASGGTWWGLGGGVYTPAICIAAQSKIYVFCILIVDRLYQ